MRNCTFTDEFSGVIRNGRAKRGRVPQYPAIYQYSRRLVEVRGSDSAARFNVEFCEILRRTSQINSFKFAILKNCSHLKIVLNIQFLAVCLGLSKTLPYIRVRDYKLLFLQKSGVDRGMDATQKILHK